MAAPQILVLGTSNPGKSQEFRELLQGCPWQLADLSQFADVSLPAEDGATYVENARRKAQEVALQIRHWVLADDTGLEVDALAGAPGIHSARYAGPGASAVENRRRLLEQLAGVPARERTARFVCQLSLADPLGRIVAEATGYCRGQLRFEPAGTGGFGYDSLFEITEYHCTLAELGTAAAACLTHRSRAVAGIWPQLLRIGS